MPDQQGYTLPLTAVRDLREVKKIVLGSSRSKLKRFRRRRGAGGGGGDGSLFVGYTTKEIPAGTGAANARQPGVGAANCGGVLQELFGASTTDSWENYGDFPVSIDSVVLVAVGNNHAVIIDWFCANQGA